MISYHFGNKEGLFLAVIQQSIGERRLRNLSQQINDESLPPIQKLHNLIAVPISVHQDHPWLSCLIIDQVNTKNDTNRWEDHTSTLFLSGCKAHNND